MNFTPGVTIKVQPFPCSRLKRGTVLEALPKHSGHLKISLLRITLQCCLTSQKKGTTPHFKQNVRYTVAEIMGLSLEEIVAGVSYVYLISISLVKIIANHMQINLAIISL